ncbi:TadE family protein [Pseudodesulfovibrio sediminis]|uniref:TadE-like domain-containing protein n=1 Tax=Pseudodesulfovibrio sediminis TaxID=2810563 RepID=A0ABN6EW17_9BACT|nr:TadE family protein [Pseudodesulfovibrio sediminis]BCS89718.1 hypothetical protein PSDVSF_29600 [Pseudodesulfovibrio sediminis]
MRHRRKKTQHKHGLAAVEMALLLPIFIMLLVGIMDAARLFWTESVVRDAAFEGARVAILNEATQTQIEETILKELKIGGINQTSDISIGIREPEQPVDVTVAVPFEFLILGSVVPSLDGSQNISATAVMTHER